jgi:hypothetical protein
MKDTLISVRCKRLVDPPGDVTLLRVDSPQAFGL